MTAAGVEAVVRLDDATLDVDRPDLGALLSIDGDQGRLFAEPFDGAQRRFEEPHADEVRISRTQPDVVERREDLADVLWNRLARQPLPLRELRVDHGVGVGLVGVGEEAALGVGEDS